MTPEQFQRVTALFNQALEIPDADRETWLAQQSEDQLVLDEVAVLLKEESGQHVGDTQLAGGGVRMLESVVAGEIPKRIAEYDIVGMIDEGGMGRVYEAQQENPRRRVALKVMRPGVATPAFVRRFQFEAHTLGLLNHPGVANVFDAGTTEHDGAVSPYFVMEYIDGQPLDRYANAMQLTQRERLELIARVCDAIQHAHQKGVIHRDLKPGNVLVMKTHDDAQLDAAYNSAWHDRIGQPKVLDFGIARVIDAKAQLTTLQTQAGQILGTLSYMSPEQIDARLDIDARCDVYALGVMLFQLLTNKLPLDVTGLTIVEAAQVIRDHDPTPAGQLDRTLRGDIETIIAKALEKDPERRYTSAAELAADIRRYLAQEPISAHPPSAMYQFRKFAGRNRALVGGATATVVALLIGLAGTIYYLLEANRQRDEANEQRTLVEAQRDDLLATQEWYGDLISQIDVADLGDSLVQDFRERLEVGLKEEQVPDMEARLAQFDELVTYANATDVAIDAIDLALFDRAEESIARQFAERPAIRAKLLSTVALAYNRLSRGHRALETLTLAKQAWHEAVDADIETLAAILRSRGHAYDVMNQADKAAEERRTYYEFCCETYGAEALDCIRAAGFLAHSLYNLDRRDESGTLLDEALALHAEHFGELDKTALDLRATYAWVLFDRGDFDEAIAMAEETAAAHARLNGPDSEAALASLSDAGLLTARAGFDERAAEILRGVVERSERVLGHDHLATNSRRHRLASVLRALREYDEAIALLDRVREFNHNVYGPDHQHSASVTRTMAMLRFRQKRYDEAERLYRDCVSIMRNTLGDDHRITTETMSELGRTLIELGRFEDAQTVLTEARDLNVAKHGIDDMRSIMFAEVIARCMVGQGLIDEALELQETELARARRIFGDNGVRTLVLSRDRAHVLLLVGRFEEAEELCHAFLAGARVRKQKAAETECLIELLSIQLATHQREAADATHAQLDTLLNNFESVGGARFRLFGGVLTALDGDLEAAEEEMLAGYQYLSENEHQMVQIRRSFMLAEAERHLADLYTAWDKPEEAQTWQALADARTD